MRPRVAGHDSALAGRYAPYWQADFPEETMADDKQESVIPDASQAFLEKLQKSGFFQQIAELDDNLKRISTDLQDLGRLATQRIQETENLAAHLLAVEAILTVVMRTSGIDPEMVKAEVREVTARLSNNPDGSPAVQTVVENLLARARSQ
jgi:hypothetical protein